MPAWILCKRVYKHRLVTNEQFTELNTYMDSIGGTNKMVEKSCIKGALKRKSLRIQKRLRARARVNALLILLRRK